MFPFYRPPPGGGPDPQQGPVLNQFRVSQNGDHPTPVPNFSRINGVPALNAQQMMGLPAQNLQPGLNQASQAPFHQPQKFQFRMNQAPQGAGRPPHSLQFGMNQTSQCIGPLQQSLQLGLNQASQGHGHRQQRLPVELNQASQGLVNIQQFLQVGLNQASQGQGVMHTGLCQASQGLGFPQQSLQYGLTAPSQGLNNFVPPFPGQALQGSQLQLQQQAISLAAMVQQYNQLLVGNLLQNQNNNSSNMSHHPYNNSMINAANSNNNSGGIRTSWSDTRLCNPERNGNDWRSNGIGGKRFARPSYHGQRKGANSRKREKPDWRKCRSPPDKEPRRFRIVYDENEVKYWRETRRRSHPFAPKNANTDHKSSDIADMKLLRMQEMKGVLAIQAKLGIDVAEISPGYICESELQTCKARKRKVIGSDEHLSEICSERNDDQSEVVNAKIKIRSMESSAHDLTKGNEHTSSDDTSKDEKLEVVNDEINIRCIESTARDLTGGDEHTSCDDTIEDEQHLLLQALRFLVINAFLDDGPGKLLEFPSVALKQLKSETEINLVGHETGTCIGDQDVHTEFRDNEDDTRNAGHNDND